MNMNYRNLLDKINAEENSQNTDLNIFIQPGTKLGRRQQILLSDTQKLFAKKTGDNDKILLYSSSQGTKKECGILRINSK